jgi:iron complex outermembrane receptor protein
LDASATARFRGAQYCENPDVGGLQPLEGSGHLDLSLGRVFQLSPGGLGWVEAAANLDNVTDAVVWDQCGLPQPGRTLRLQIRLW